MSNGEFMSKRTKTQVEEEEQGRWFLQYNIIIGLKSVFGWEVSEAVCVSKFSKRVFIDLVSVKLESIRLEFCWNFNYQLGVFLIQSRVLKTRFLLCKNRVFKTQDLCSPFKSQLSNLELL